MDAREEIKRWLLTLTQLAADSESEQINADIELLMGVTLQLTTELSNRNAALAKQCRPRSTKPPKPAPQKGPHQQNDKQSSSDAPDNQKDAEGRSQRQSRIMQGVKQSDASREDQQQLRHQIYGVQNKDVAFRKAAKEIAS
jgi:hypothetical protein